MFTTRRNGLRSPEHSTARRITKSAANFFVHLRLRGAIGLVAVAAILLPSLARASLGDEAAPLLPDEPRYLVEVPEVVLTTVPVKWVRITRLNDHGERDADFQGRPLVEGVRLTVGGQDTALPAFQDGLLELETNLAVGRRVYVSAGEIVVDPDSRGRGDQPVRRIAGWFSILPPILAIVLAVWLRNVLVALLAAIWAGALVLSYGNPLTATLSTLNDYLLGELVQPGDPDKAHMQIILFTTFLGALIGVMSHSGATTALVNRMSRFTQSREHGQLLTWAMGLIVFFDDYANTLLVGGTMRPVTDRLKISREKLAFLVDSTAAPIAGLAIISTWVGVEIGYIADTYADLTSTYQDLDLQWDGYSIFLATIPYRFYPLHLIVFVLLIAYSGHDYGAMLRAEARASRGDVIRPGSAVPGIEDSDSAGSRANRLLVRNALIPLGTLLLLIVLGLWWTGASGLAAANQARAAAGSETIPTSLASVLQHSDSNQVLFVSSFLASLVAVLCAVTTGALSLHNAMEGWLDGGRSMFLALAILVLAWGVATVCNTGHLNTAGFLVESTQGLLSVRWMPALTFVLAAVVAFATGSSWSTMGLLMPLSISVTFSLLVQINEADPNHHLMLATIGAVLAGAIFGDHCSPISDTTVLSSAAAGCDHLDHVTTQLPYALSVGAVALLFGYVPAAFGYTPFVLLPIGLIVVYLLVQFVGRPLEQHVEIPELELDD
jgi:Na+/H+ antiporter NhaC